MYAVCFPSERLDRTLDHDGWFCLFAPSPRLLKASVGWASYPLYVPSTQPIGRKAECRGCGATETGSDANPTQSSNVQACPSLRDSGVRMVGLLLLLLVGDLPRRLIVFGHRACNGATAGRRDADADDTTDTCSVCSPPTPTFCLVLG